MSSLARAFLAAIFASRCASIISALSLASRTSVSRTAHHVFFLDLMLGKRTLSCSILWASSSCLLGLNFRESLGFLHCVFVGLDVGRDSCRALPHGFVSCVSFGFQTSLLDAVHPLQLHFSLVLCLLFGFFSSLSFGALSAKRRKG